MSVQFMQKAFEVAGSDQRLTPADKLILLRWAWKTKDPATPYEIKYRTVSRELGLSRNAVKSSVRRLARYGYLSVVSVSVVCGPAFQISETVHSKGGQSVTPKGSDKGGQSVTRGGSVSDPQKGQSVTPIKKKRYKKGPAAQNLSDLGRYAIACLAAGNPVILAGGFSLQPDDPEYRRLSDQLRNEPAQ